jgi:hypothetical protein
MPHSTFAAREAPSASVKGLWQIVLLATPIPFSEGSILDARKNTNSSMSMISTRDLAVRGFPLIFARGRETVLLASHLEIRKIKRNAEVTRSS